MNSTETEMNLQNESQGQNIIPEGEHPTNDPNSEIKPITSTIDATNFQPQDINSVINKMQIDAQKLADQHANEVLNNMTNNLTQQGGTQVLDTINLGTVQGNTVSTMDINAQNLGLKESNVEILDPIYKQSQHPTQVHELNTVVNL